MIEGHFFVEVFLSDNKWYLVDSSNGTLFLNYDPNNFSISSGGRDYYIYAKSIEVIDSGITDDRDIGPIQIRCFKEFDTLKFERPTYNTMMLN